MLSVHNGGHWETRHDDHYQILTIHATLIMDGPTTSLQLPNCKFESSQDHMTVLTSSQHIT